MECNVLYSAGEIQEKIQDLASQITEFYADKPVVGICVLKGAFVFFSDLVRQMPDLDLELDFVRLSSYQDATESSGRVVFSKDIEIDIEGKHVLVIEDIVDSGRTMMFLTDVFKARKPASVRICSLIDKTERRVEELTVDFSCFSIEGGFVVGYGLDYAEKYRHLPDLCVLTF